MKNKILMFVCVTFSFAWIEQGVARIPNCTCPTYGPPPLCSEEGNRLWKEGSPLLLGGGECYEDCNCNRTYVPSRRCQGADLKNQRPGTCG